MGLPWWLSGKESACQCRRWELDLQVRKIFWRRKCLPTPVFLPGESHGQRILVGYSPQDFERAGHDLATKQPPPLTNTYCFAFYTFPPLVFYYETFQTRNWTIVLWALFTFSVFALLCILFVILSIHHSF